MAFGFTRGAVAVLVGAAALAMLRAEGTQSGRNLEPPPTWRAAWEAPGRDRPIVVMRPGWQIKPGGAGLFWDPGWFASGQYAVTSALILFPAGLGMPQSGVETPYGLVLGGDRLDTDARSYVSFLVQNDGRFTVARHANGATTPLVPWTRLDAIATLGERSSGTARNELTIDVGTDHVTLWVNNIAASRLPRDGLPLAGTIGLYIGAGLSVHVRGLVIGPNHH